MAPTEAEIGFLRESEIGAAGALVSAAGWNQTAHDWRTFLALGTVYAVREGERLVATAATLPHQRRFGWISMVLVAQDRQRRGLATSLMRRCIDDLVAGGMVPILDATPAGREVYKLLGFEDAWRFRRMVATDVRLPPAAAVRGAALEPVGEHNRGEVWAYDTGAFGADRAAVLDSLLARCPQAAWLVRREGRVAGFVLARDGLRRDHAGPLVADDGETAALLFSAAASALRRPLQIDASDLQPEFLAALRGMGFEVERPFTRMLLGRAAGFEDTARIFAVAGPEFG